MCELPFVETRFVRNHESGEPVARAKTWHELPVRTGQQLMTQLYKAKEVEVDVSAIGPRT